jgi:hypothetical protein
MNGSGRFHLVHVIAEANLVQESRGRKQQVQLGAVVNVGLAIVTRGGANLDHFVSDHTPAELLVDSVARQDTAGQRGHAVTVEGNRVERSDQAC